MNFNLYEHIKPASDKFENIYIIYCTCGWAKTIMITTIFKNTVNSVNHKYFNRFVVELHVYVPFEREL